MIGLTGEFSDVWQGKDLEGKGGEAEARDFAGSACRETVPLDMQIL